MATPIPLEAQRLYAELLERLIGMQAQDSLGQLTGSSSKESRGETSLYWQASQP